MGFLEVPLNAGHFSVHAAENHHQAALLIRSAFRLSAVASLAGEHSSNTDFFPADPDALLQPSEMVLGIGFKFGGMEFMGILSTEIT